NGAETTWQAPLDERRGEQASIADTIFLSGGLAGGEATAEHDEPIQTVARKRTLLTQALLIKESPQKPATTTTEEPTPLLIRGAAKPPRLARRGGPRSSLRRGFITQIAVTIMAAALLIGGITSTTPLGRNIAGLTGFDAYANAIPWIPTPTPTPKPRPNTPSYANDPGKLAVANEIKAVFGSYAAGAINVATCESGLNPNARNTTPIGDSHAEGVFQILYPSTWNGTSYRNESPYNYAANIRAAYEIFKRDGYSWREWACQP
ncbi:MAG TPA: hypothetical protein VGP82_25630, partial [Ktedonobacterales bacterium]|nr:hypothetical protein [Ktedonobacterales bacterium]